LADRYVDVVHEGERPVRVRLEREDDDEEALRRRVVQAARIGDELGADAGGAVDRRRIAVERVQVDSVIDVSRMPGDDVGGSVVRKDRVPRGVVDVENIVDGLEHKAVTGTQPLIGRFDGELVSATRIALLIMVQTFEAGVELRVRLGLLATGHRHTAPGALR
jgi:hypothetical protein